MSKTNTNLWSGPLGPLRDKRVITVGSDDVLFPLGAIVQAGTTGDLVYITLEGSVELTETIATVGDFIGVAGIPVLIKEVKGTSTVTSIVVGEL